MAGPFLRQLWALSPLLYGLVFMFILSVCLPCSICPLNASSLSGQGTSLTVNITDHSPDSANFGLGGGELRVSQSVLSRLLDAKARDGGRPAGPAGKGSQEEMVKWKGVVWSIGSSGGGGGGSRAGVDTLGRELTFCRGCLIFAIGHFFLTAGWSSPGIARAK